MAHFEEKLTEEVSFFYILFNCCTNKLTSVNRTKNLVSVSIGKGYGIDFKINRSYACTKIGNNIEIKISCDVVVIFAFVINLCGKSYIAAF